MVNNSDLTPDTARCDPPLLSPETTATILMRTGFSFVPIKIDGSKEPSVKWAEYQTRKPTPDEARGWWGNGVTRGGAAIQGKISGNSETVDFDDPELFEPFEEALRDRAPGLFGKQVITRTPRPGYQVTYRCQVIGQNRGLAFGERPARPDDRPESVYENDAGEFVVKAIDPSACARVPLTPRIAIRRVAIQASRPRSRLTGGRACT
jgi:Bifunctional DNA primase/polymerase, N-terminal